VKVKDKKKAICSYDKWIPGRLSVFWGQEVAIPISTNILDTTITVDTFKWGSILKCDA
jgi:hypothetical protein